MGPWVHLKTMSNMTLYMKKVDPSVKCHENGSTPPHTHHAISKEFHSLELETLVRRALGGAPDSLGQHLAHELQRRREHDGHTLRLIERRAATHAADWLLAVVRQKEALRARFVAPCTTKAYGRASEITNLLLTHDTTLGHLSMYTSKIYTSCVPTKSRHVAPREPRRRPWPPRGGRALANCSPREPRDGV